jgi:membrane protein DedA with SNARE-associated domain
LLVNGLSVPGRDETTIPVVLEALPGAIIGMAICWWIGNRQERQLEEAEAAEGY